MNRRYFLASGAAAVSACTHVPDRPSEAVLVALRPPLIAETRATRWTLRQSEGFEAICFWGVLTQQPMKEDFAADGAAFAPRMPAESMRFLEASFAMARDAGANLVHSACRFLSAGPDMTIDDLVRSIDNIDLVLKPVHEADPEYEGAALFERFRSFMPQTRAVLLAMKDAGFQEFWHERADAEFDREAARLQRQFRGYDLVPEISRATGRRYQPNFEIVLAHWAYPTSMKMLGQKFVTWPGYGDDVIKSVAAHESMHPPLDLNGHAMAAAVSQLSYLGPLAQRSGEGDVENYVEECMVQALDQIVAARLGAHVEPAAYFSRLEGKYVVAAAFYGWLVDDGWDRTGGDFERWVAQTAASERLQKASLVASASRVIGRAVTELD